MTVRIYAEGLATMSVCAPAKVPVKEVERLVNVMRPTGISSRWAKAKDRTFIGGQSNPCKCGTIPGHKHWLMRC